MRTTDLEETVKLNCDKCQDEIETPAALLFAPPVEGLCHKIHLCQDCFAGFLTQIFPSKPTADKEVKGKAVCPECKGKPNTDMGNGLIVGCGTCQGTGETQDEAGKV